MKSSWAREKEQTDRISYCDFVTLNFVPFIRIQKLCGFEHLIILLVTL